MTLTRAIVSGALALTSVSAGAQGGIAGTVYDSLSTHAPLANATVVLVERSRYATTDARGRFQIDSVPDGHYTIGFMHPVLDSLDLQPPVVSVDVAGGRRVTVMLATPSPATAYASICPGARETDTGVIIGRVRDVDERAPLADATVSTEWTEFTVAAGDSAGRRVRAAAKTDAAGLYLLCGVPAQVPLNVRTELAGFVAGPTPLLLDDRLISRVDFALSRRDSAARDVPRRDSAAIGTASSGTASLRGTVRDGDGRPVPNVVAGVAGTSRFARTDGAGAFRITHIPAGTRTIELRSIGSAPLTFSVDFATNAVRDTTLRMVRQPQALTPVTVRDRGGSLSMMEREGYEARRLQGLGAFVTEQELARHALPDLTAVLVGVRGMHIEYGTNGFPMPYMHGIADIHGSYCVPNFFLDGAPFTVVDPDPPTAQGKKNPAVKIPQPDPKRFAELSDWARPAFIRGIEVYSNAGTIPAQYDYTSSTGCGSVVIWTR